MLSANVTIAADTRQTLYVDSVHGSDTSNGLTPQSAFKSVDGLIKHLGSNTDVFFHAGETFNVDQGIATPYQNVLFSSYGTGTQPVLYRIAGNGSSCISMFQSSANIVVQNLTFDSMYKPVGVLANKIQADGIFPAGSDITIRKCTFLNLDTGINDERTVQGTLVQDCTAPLTTGLRGVFIWGQGTDQVYLGNFVANSTREHIVRTVWVERSLISANNFTNLDRTDIGDLNDTAKGTVDVHRGSYAYVSNNYLYGGELRIGPRVGPAKAPGDTSNWCVFEGNHVFGHEIQVYPGTYHVMMRNNIVSDDFTAIISVVPHNAAGDNIQDLTFVNNTGITSAVGGEFINITEAGTPGSITLQNNLWIAPNIIPGEYGDAAVYIDDTNAAVLNLSATNVWPSPAYYNPYAAGGINYVYASWLPPHGYMTPAVWDLQSYVKNDLFSQTVISSADVPASNSVAATAGTPAAGVFVDVNGKPRPSNGI